MAFEFSTNPIENVDLCDLSQTTTENIPVLTEIERIRRRQERTSFTQKRAHMPRENTP